MALEIKAWAIQEANGGRAGKLITTYAPYWHAVKTALFHRQVDAQQFIKNTGQTHRLRTVQVKVTIEKIGKGD